MRPKVSPPGGANLPKLAFHQSFPDWRSTFEELVAEGDRVAERWTGRGTHRGELQGIAPTGKRVEVPGSVFYRIVDGKIVELWGQLDMMSLMQQLGAIGFKDVVQGTQQPQRIILYGILYVPILRGRLLLPFGGGAGNREAPSFSASSSNRTPRGCVNNLYPC